MEIHKLKSYDFDFIQSLIDNEIEESIHIEFKSAGALSKNDAVKKEISKDVSAFANSDGGIIIYGLNELNHKATSISLIDGNTYTKEWLEQVISSTIQRNIPDLKIFPIRKDGKISSSIYVVQIPQSYDVPHIAKDKRYYKRYNFQVESMEEYEIRGLYSKKSKSKLVLSDFVISYLESTDQLIKFACESGVYNDGEVPESDFKVNVYFDNFDTNMMNIHSRTDGAYRNFDYTILKNNRIKCSNFGNSTIFPAESVNVIRFNFDIKKENIEDFLKVLKIEIRLFYSNGEDIMNTDLVDFYETKIKRVL